MGAIHGFTGGRANGLGPELIIDGAAFSNGSLYWTLGADWSITTGLRANYASGGSGTRIKQSLLDVNDGGKTYRLEFSIVAGTGTVYATLDGTSASIVGPDRTGTGSYTSDLVFPADRGNLEALRFNGAGSSAVSINTISLRQVY